MVNFRAEGFGSVQWTQVVTSGGTFEDVLKSLYTLIMQSLKIELFFMHLSACIQTVVNFIVSELCYIPTSLNSCACVIQCLLRFKLGYSCYRKKTGAITGLIQSELFTQYCCVTFTAPLTIWFRNNFHSQKERNSKQHIELNVKFWSSKPEILFSCKIYSKHTVSVRSVLNSFHSEIAGQFPK